MEYISPGNATDPDKSPADDRQMAQGELGGGEEDDPNTMPDGTPIPPGAEGDAMRAEKYMSFSIYLNYIWISVGIVIDYNRSGVSIVLQIWSWPIIYPSIQNLMFKNVPMTLKSEEVIYRIHFG